MNEQLCRAATLEICLGICVGLVQDLTRFHRVVIYQFDHEFNGQVVAELVDRDKTTDLYSGLMFPASDIPVQARKLYEINKVRLLYDRSRRSARMVLRRREELDTPLDMTRCYLRAMSPIHVKCKQFVFHAANFRSGKYGREVFHVGLDHGFWPIMGFT
jgi:light-regulated signal transduction histidine kinase (bacteriophytochrome)